MPAPRFLLKTDLARFEPLVVAGRPATAQYETLKSLLEARGLGVAAAIFAEPISGAGAISWYGVGSGDPQPLTTLSPERRAEAERRLAAALAPVAELLDDPEAGPLLRRALVVGAAEQIVVLDDAVILAGWGTAPREAVGDEAIARHARGVLGRFVPRLAAIDAGFFSPIVAAPTPARAVAGETTAAASPRPRIATAPATPAAASDAAAPRGGGPGWWLVPTLVGVAIAFLALGFWLAWTHLVQDMAGRNLQAGIVDLDRTRMAIRMQQETNEALEKEIERARRAAQAQDVCRPEGPITGQSLPPLPQSQPVPQAAIPPAVPPPPGQAAAPVNSLANLLEHATVMIVTAGPKGIGHGSGFFIAGDLVASNAHVVEHADAEQIFVMSKSMGRAVKAQRVAMTSQPGNESEPGKPDFALLKLPEQIAGAQPLAITTTVEKLTDIVAAGYPASVVRVEAGMTALREGRIGDSPELVLTRGTISTIQKLPNGLTVMPHSADISPGNSGGPLVDLCGRVVGVNTFVSRATDVADRVRYAQKSDDLVEWLRGKATPQMREGVCQPEAPRPTTPAPGPTPAQTPPPAPAPAPAPAPPANR
jgi:S1-C subfamily serine protease